MWGWLSLVACLSGPLMGLGRLEGLLLRKGRLAVASASRYVWRGVGVVGCRVCWYRRHTLCCLCLVVVGAPFCVLGACGGGMLSGFWGSAPWVARPVQGSISWGFGWVWVGWL